MKGGEREQEGSGAKGGEEARRPGYVNRSGVWRNIRDKEQTLMGKQIHVTILTYSVG